MAAPAASPPSWSYKGTTFRARRRLENSTAFQLDQWLLRVHPCAQHGLWTLETVHELHSALVNVHAAVPAPTTTQPAMLVRARYKACFFKRRVPPAHHFYALLHIKELLHLPDVRAGTMSVLEFRQRWHDAAQRPPASAV